MVTSFQRRVLDIAPRKWGDRKIASRLVDGMSTSLCSMKIEDRKRKWIGGTNQ